MQESVKYKSFKVLLNFENSCCEWWFDWADWFINANSYSLIISKYTGCRTDLRYRWYFRNLFKWYWFSSSMENCADLNSQQHSKSNRVPCICIYFFHFFLFASTVFKRIFSFPFMLSCDFCETGFLFSLCAGCTTISLVLFTFEWVSNFFFWVHKQRDTLANATGLQTMRDENVFIYSSSNKRFRCMRSSITLIYYHSQILRFSSFFRHLE